MRTPSFRRALRHLAAWPAALLLAGAAHAAAPPAGLTACRLPDLDNDAWCGVLKRPLDPARPQGTQIDVHYAVVPALARNKKPDAVFFFAGGPGQSAMDLAGPVAQMYERFSNRHDLVFVDQRGTGRSAPLKCEEEDPTLSVEQAFDPAHQQQHFDACLAALQKLPYGDLRFFTTTIAMQDVDAVRAALGIERIDAIGVSYGTRAALEYQRQFPQHVRRTLIDSVAPPDMVLPEALSADNQAALDALVDACAKEAACTARHPQLATHWHQLLAGLPRTVTIAHPLTGEPQTVTVSRAMVLSMVRMPLYSPALAAGLPEAIDDAADGRFGPMAALGAQVQKSLDLALGMHFSVVCAEDVPRMGLSGGPHEAPGTDFGTDQAEEYRRVCAHWPRGEVPAAFYTVPPARSAVLVLSGSADPVTPPRHGQQVAQALGPLARHVVVPNAGHGVASIGCMRDVVFRFFDAETDADALKVDAQCVASMPRPVAFVPVLPPERPASGAEVAPLKTSTPAVNSAKATR